MPVRISPVDAASRRATQQLNAAIGDLRAARQAAGLSQATVARALGCSAQLVSLLEAGAVEPRPIQLARWGAVVGLDVPIRTFAAGSPLRDAGQLRLLTRFRAALGEAWAWATEVAVSEDPRDRRAIDAVLSRGPHRVGVEAIVRLTDAQAQVRGLLLKQQTSGLERMVVVLADSGRNRVALRDGAPTIQPAFPLGARETMRALRAGVPPRANGVVVA